MIFNKTIMLPCGSAWGITNPELREELLNVRPVVVLDMIRNPTTGLQELVIYQNYRAADLPLGGGSTVTVLWDEMILDPGDQSLTGHMRRHADCGD